MLLETALTTAAAAGLWYLLRTDPERLHGIYSQPGRLFYPKKWLMYLALKLERRQTNRPRLETKKQGKYIDICYKPGHPIDGLEYTHDLDNRDKAKALDVVSFNGMNTDGACFTMRIARRHDREAELWLSIKLPGVGCFQSPTHPHTIEYNTDGKSFSAGGLRFECVEPHLKWRITFNGLLRQGFHDKLSGLDAEDADLVHARFSFDWMAFSDPFNFETENDPWLTADAIARESWTATFFKNLRMSHTHYQQWGELRGVINIEGYSELKVYMRTCKSRSFGNLDKGRVHRSVAHYGFSEDGTTFHLAAVSLPGSVSNHQCGYVNRPNSLQHAVTSTDLDLPRLGENMPPPAKYAFSFKGNGKLYEVTVDTSACTSPVYYCGEDWSSVVFQQMCQLTVNGEKGYGITDFFYKKRSGGDCPVPLLKSVPLLREPSVVATEYEEALVLPFGNPSCCSSRLVGGKGCQLAMLTQMDIMDNVAFSVPPGFCLTITAFNRHIQSMAGHGRPTYDSIEVNLDLLAECASGKRGGDLKMACQKTTQAFLESALCLGVKELTKMHLQALCAGEESLEEVTFAVRSSASGEDGDELSGAGQMDTLLGVKGVEQVFNAVKRCWGSNFAFPAVEYRRQHGQPIKSPIAVVIQRMLFPDASGVLFTRNPLDGNPTYLVVNANYGLGESVVSGDSQPDTVTVKKSLHGEVTIHKKEIGLKDTRTAIADGGGTEVVRVPSDDKNRCCIANDVILQLAQIGIQLEKSFAGPRDVEWAVADNQIYLLQARPMTAMDQQSDWEIVHEFDSPLTTDRSMLTRHNTVESAPHAMTPLQTSLMHHLEDSSQIIHVSIGLCQFVRRYALVMPSYCNKVFINLHAGMGANEDKVFGGNHQAAIVSLCGTTIPELTLDSLHEYHDRNPWWLKLVNAVNLLKTMLRAHKGIQIWGDRLKTYKIELEGRTAQQLYDDILSRDIDHTECMHAHSLNTTTSMAWKSVLLNILTPQGSEQGNQQWADLALLLSKISHEGSCCNSTDVPHALQELAGAIKKADPSGTFLSMSSEQATEWLTADNGEVGEMFTRFMKEHGHRGILEVYIDRKSWNQDPSSLIQSLQAMVMAPAMSQKLIEGEDIGKAIASLGSPTTAISRWVLKHVVPRARKATGGREWSKAVFIRLIDQFKQAYWKLAGLMVEEGRLPDEKLLYYFTQPEIGQLLQTRSGKLIARAQRRRRLHAYQESCTFPLVLTGHPQPILVEEPNAEEDTSRSVGVLLKLQGTPVSRGFIKGTVRVVKTVNEAHSIEPGEILVVQTTDVGWSPYFPLISGLVTEIGGLLSHGVVVAREYGIPCVVNISGATVLLKTGDVITLNGTEGTVERLE